MFRALGARVLDSAWSGYNATLLAYGQTGAGKSYSMMGTGIFMYIHIYRNIYTSVVIYPLSLCCSYV